MPSLSVSYDPAHFLHAQTQSFVPNYAPPDTNSGAHSAAAYTPTPSLQTPQPQAYAQAPPTQQGYYAVGPNGATVFVSPAVPQTPQPQPNTILLQQLEREFRDIEERDPSLADGFRVVYDREVPFELRPADSRDHDVGALEGIKVKILTQGEDNSVSAVRIELTSEADLFFHYTCLVNAVGFTQLREDQKLMCEFKEFVVTLLKMCNRCIREPNHFLAVLLLNTDGSASLEFIQNVEYKFIDLLVLPFRESPDHIVKADITYRYNAVRSRLSIMTSKLQDVTALVKVRPQ